MPRPYVVHTIGELGAPVEAAPASSRGLWIFGAILAAFVAGVVVVAGRT